MRGEALFLIVGALKIGANHYVKHDLNKWMWLLWLQDTNIADRNTSQSMKGHSGPKKEEKEMEISSLQCFSLRSLAIISTSW